MKQFSFVVEVVCTSESENLILVRDPRSGVVVKTMNSPEELTNFLSETITKVKETSNN